MKLLIIFGILSVQICWAAIEWTRETVNLSEMTKEVYIESNSTEYLIPFSSLALECPHPAVCIQTLGLEIREMKCATDPSTDDPTYLIINGFKLDPITGEDISKKNRTCLNIGRTDKALTIFENFDPVEILIQPLGSDWSNGNAFARILIRSSLRINLTDSNPDQGSDDKLDRLRREMIYMEEYLYRGFVVTSTLILLLGIFIVLFIGLQMKRLNDGMKGMGMGLVGSSGRRPRQRETERNGVSMSGLNSGPDVRVQHEQFKSKC